MVIYTRLVWTSETVTAVSGHYDLQQRLGPATGVWLCKRRGRNPESSFGAKLFSKVQRQTAKHRLGLHERRKKKRRKRDGWRVSREPRGTTEALKIVLSTLLGWTRSSSGMCQEVLTHQRTSFVSQSRRTAYTKNNRCDDPLCHRLVSLRVGVAKGNQKSGNT
ncbi:hypothetical protein EYF80_044113 [Liparis tanakae]|uniref:Uncharacterized protein n=1 Tax=Liparis tanakae TaxID=230148 RepID=A0A4Z2FYP7_9TELE|nr:hypothetical protein EYF80_044113 [Liparis tanakae]